MKTLFIILSVCIVNTSFTQDNPNNKSWKFGVNFSPEMGYRVLKIGDTSNYHLDDLKQIRDKWEKPIMVYTTGLFAEYKINNLVSLKIGTHYSQRGQMMKYSWGLEPGYSEATKEEYTISKMTYHHIGFPISTSIYLLNKPKVGVFSSIGCQFDFLYKGSWLSKSKQIGEEEKTAYSQNYIKKDNYEGFNIFSPAIVASVGVDWKFSTKSILRLEPIFRRSLIPLLKSTLLEYNYNVGLNFSYIYSIK